MKKRFLWTAAFALLSVGNQLAFAQQNPAPAANMSFFVTSSNLKGGNLGGLTGASQGCGMEQLQPTGGAGLFYCFATN